VSEQSLDSSPTGATGERVRIREAMVDLVVERGYAGATVEMVLDRAGLDRAAFERHFAGFDDCYMQLFVEFTAEFDRITFGAYETTAGPWRDRLRAAAYGAARYIRDHPRESAFSSTLMFAAGDIAQAHRERHLRRLIDLIDAGREEMADPGTVSRAVAESAVGSIYGVSTRMLQEEGGVASIEALVPELMYVAVRPYLGHEAAREELAMPPPPEERSEGGS
jgi:AcrR family transcriptional regulator